MKTTTGSLPLKTGSSAYPNSAYATLLEVVLLLGLGAAAVALHAAMRHRLEIGPGHQGLWWMAMLMMGRLTSRQRWAGMTTAAGAAGATFLPVWHLGDPLLWLAFALAGAVVDLGYRAWMPSSGRGLWALTLLGGVAHATKPLIRVGEQAFGLRYESLLGGVAFPTASHFFYGAIGAFVGSLLVLLRRRSG